MAKMGSGEAYHVLAHVDAFVLPLLRADLPVVREAVANYSKSKGAPNLNRLEEAELTFECLAALFPASYLDLLASMFRYLCYSVNLIGEHVSFLDILQVLTIFCRGSVEEKGTLLFELFNFTGSGRMSELELIRFIVKASDNFQKLKLTGALEVTMDDARYIAMLARVREDGSDLLPFLQLADFQRFLKTNAVTVAIMKIVDTLNRLYLTMLNLGGRASLLLEELQKREEPMSHRLPTPRMDTLDCKLNCGKALVVQVGATYCSLALRSAHLDPSLSEVFARCVKIHAIEEKKDGDDGTCCAYRETTFYQRCKLRKGAASGPKAPFYSCAVTQLEMGCKYHIVVYSRGLFFEEFALLTAARRSIASAGDCEVLSLRLIVLMMTKIKFMLLYLGRHTPVFCFWRKYFRCE